MNRLEPCDLAIWDVDGTLTHDLRRGLKRRRQWSGPKLSVVLGEWRDRRLAVARPRRLTAAALPSITQALLALAAAHEPAWFLVVGPAKGPATDFGVGETVRHAETLVGTPGEPIRVATLVEGPVEPGQPATLATAWVEAALTAADAIDTPLELLAVVTSVVETDHPIVPPPARPTTAARQLGGWVGRMIRPAARVETVPPVDMAAVTQAVSILLPHRPRRMPPG